VTTAPDQIAVDLRALERAMEAGAAGAAEAVLARGSGADWTAAAATAAGMRVVANASPALTTASGRLNALRLIAVSRSEHDREEVASQLYEAARRLVAVGDVDWAAGTAIYWQECYSYMPLALAESVRMGEQLLDEWPQLAQTSPLLVAMVAVKASLAGNREVADRRWREALHHPQLGTSADDYWRVHGQWATHELVGHAGELTKAVNTLRRVRNHFRGRTDGDSLDQMHNASMNLAYQLVLLGRPQRALEELATDLPHCPPDGIHAGFLHLLEAVAHADLGHVEQARRLLDECIHTVPANNPVALLAGIGPARMLMAAAEKDRRAVDEQVASLMRAELEGPSSIEDTIVWRLVAARAYSAVGSPVPAARSVADALRGCRRKELPFHAAWANLLRAALAPPDDDAADAAAHLAAALGVQYQLVDLFTLREPVHGPAALLRALGRSSPPDQVAFTVRCLQLVGERAACAAVAEHVARGGDQRAADAVLTELGWSPAPVRASAPHLHVRVLGGLRLEINGTDAAADEAWRGRRKAKLLLARLLTAHGAPVRFERLVEDLWEHPQPASGGRVLAPLVHTLRRVLEPGLAPRDSGTYLHTGRGSYRLSLAAEDRCDMDEFIELAQATLTRTGAGAVATGEQALAAYGGEFLAGAGYDDWIVEVRERLDTLWQSTVLHVATNRSPADAHRSLDALELLFARNPASEICCRLLMRIYAEAGDMGRASKTYHRMRDRLSVELGLSPSQESRTLFAALIGA
jgi:DNA-binding SARP family transcriptional activator